MKNNKDSLQSYLEKIPKRQKKENNQSQGNLGEEGKRVGDLSATDHISCDDVFSQK